MGHGSRAAEGCVKIKIDFLRQPWVWAVAFYVFFKTTMRKGGK
ncbi:hypothetical protein O163_11105 [Caldanaerobacter subterraneus subsp. yonseiensis KB-1]|uniref:Uncharacterized protein n=1 Tax=Caldanaerobacter subterraneus subsp. yonseiensis KB-1 TaxID=1388761 RepID=U5CNE2_CALSX|nr:hypothetical protein O163_11105 [Caldanaerobacter subterraneus subsp. yonseiensis KB-1]